MSETPELLPCPFCGGEARPLQSGGFREWIVECRICGGGSDYFSAKTDAIAAWNRRTPAPDTGTDVTKGE